MAWEDNHNVIYSEELQIDESRRWVFRLEEHKKRGTLSMSARMFKKTPDYDGPTKNGFIQQIDSEEDLDKLEQAFNKFFKATREKL